MRWLDDFKAQKGDDPQDRYEDEVLGLISWSADDEAWAGEHCGRRFLIAFERQPTPTKELLVYAREMLADPAQFIGAFDRAKSTAIAENPRFADEAPE
jgi:hypothetical protein